MVSSSTLAQQRIYGPKQRTGVSAAARIAAWVAYGTAFFIVYGSLVPFDFAATSGDAWGVLTTEAFRGRSRSITDAVVNFALYVPLAFAWLAAACGRAGLATAQSPGTRGATQHPTPRLELSVVLRVLIGCAALSLVVEAAQVFTGPRVSAWTDCVWNLLGAAAGVVVWAVAGTWVMQQADILTQSVPLPRRPLLVGLAVLLPLPFLLIVAALNGWFTRDWLPSGLERIEQYAWIPFYYHHGATIARAVLSSIKHSLLYAPAGMLYLMWRSRAAESEPFRQLPAAMLSGALLAMVFEASKLFLAGLRPDTGNIVVAALGAGAGWFALYTCLRPARAQIEPAAERPTSSAWQHERSRQDSVRPMLLRTTAVIAAAAVVWALAAYPVANLFLATILAFYAVALARYPSAWLVVLPAVLPVLDLTPWSGWAWLTPFDLFVGTTIAIGYWRGAGERPRVRVSRRIKLALVLVSVSYLVSMAIGLWPLQPLDYAAFSHPFSRYAALLPVKALFAALALIPLACRALDRGEDIRPAFTLGMIAGLSGVCGVALWERIAFPGLLDFNATYRIAASFSSMNTGGGHVEAYLVLALPFAVAGMVYTRRTLLRAASGALFVLGVYTLLVTYSRAGYAGFGISVAALIALVAYASVRATRRARHALLGLLTLVGIATLVAALGLGGRFVQSRFATTAADFETRLAHWQDVLQTMSPGWGTSLFGMGLGRYPETYFYRGTQARPSAPFRFHTENGNTFLRFGVGAPLYVEQIVDVEPQRAYTLTFEARSTAPQAQVHVLLCERTYFFSAGCASASVAVRGAPGEWSRYTAPIHSGRIGGTPWYAHRPVKLSLENASRDAALDIDHVQLADSEGRDRVINGDFANGGARWYFSSAVNHLPWHIKSLPLEVYFGQGAFGLLAFAALALVGGGAMLTYALRGDPFSCAALAAFAGLAAVGLFDSLFDSPALLAAIFLVLVAWACGVRYGEPIRRRRRRRRKRSETGDLAVSQTATESAAKGADAAPASVSPGAAARAGAPRNSTERKGALPWQADVPWRHLAGGAAVCFAIGWLVTHAPMVPYNVRELPNPSHPILALLILTAFLYWAFGLPAWIAGWLGAVARRSWLYPVAAVGHAWVAWLLLHLAVLPESIHDVVGSPVLGWWWEWERMGRFTALFAVLSLQLIGAAQLVGGDTRSGSASWLGWLGACLVVLPLSYWVIVPMAATDNLVELIAERGSPGSSLFLAGWMFVLAAAGSAIAAASVGSRPGALAAILLAAVSIPVAWVLLRYGLEPEVVRGRQSFSALQFLLSADRRRLASNTELMVRYVILHVGFLGVIGLVQYPFWLYARRRRA